MAIPGRGRMALVLATLAVVMLLADARPAAAGGDKVLDDLLFELQLVPLEGQEPAPFELERFADGKRVTLAELRGQPVLLYFWATW
jgi:cytochrome oxidase Cu insertion factor (SCO1/SenC/PrrC family)